MTKMTPEKQLEIIKRGTAEIISEKELLEKLKEAASQKRPLRIKYGADPSAPDIHLGHTVPLKKLRDFQDLGHTVVFIIGDFTARIGDPSMKSDTRKRLDAETVKANARTYEQQVFKILDRSKTEVCYNSSWFAEKKFEDVLELTSKYTVARMLERDDFAKRYAQNRPISMLEFLYPLIQGYDSVEIKADVELGGTDQKFNFIVARNLQRDYGHPPQAIITLPILVGTDGTDKMSKSLGNFIGVDEDPYEMLGKVMSVSDETMMQYYDLLTTVPLEKVKKTHPREAKMKLAISIVEQYHSSQQATDAQARFEKVFARREDPDDMPEIALSPDELKDGKIWVVKLAKLCSLDTSAAEVRRLIKQGGLKIDGSKIVDEGADVEVREGTVVQAGKRKFGRITLKG